MSTDMRFRILGPLEVSLAGRPVPIRAAKHRTLLASLLLRANRVVPVDALVERLWAGNPPARARGTLQTYVLRLRQTLGDPALVRTAPEGYYIEVPPGSVDLERFRELSDEGTRAGDAGDLTAAAAALDEALQLWRGAPLADVPSEELQRNVVPQLVEQHLQVLERRIDIDLQRGRHQALIAELQSLTAKHPTREPFWGQLMLALHRSGRQADALAAYQGVAGYLADELGIDPGEPLRRLHQAMLRNDPELLAPIASEAARPVVVPSQLPADIADFVGREELIDELVARFDRGTPTGPVTVMGPPGVGKTAFVVHLAHKLRPRFPDGQLYANLRGYALGPALSTAQVLSRFLRAMGVPPEQIPIDVDHQAATFRALVDGKRMLIVLDNAAAADQIRPLLPPADGCAVLVTSRNDLRNRLAGVDTVLLEPLTPDESRQLLSAVLGPDLKDLPASTELARLCAYLPLALRIAAANLAKSPPSGLADYVAELRNGNRLSALSIAGDEGTAVRAAFDLSYTTLQPRARELFRLLGLVPGPDFTPQAAAALMATDAADATELLDQLAAVHLVQQAVPGRFQFHDLIRLYAAQREHEENTRTERDIVVRRLLDHYLAGAIGAAHVAYRDLVRLVVGRQRGRAFATEAEALAWLDAERLNLIAAFGYAARHHLSEQAVRLADALRGYFLAHQYNVDWFATASTAVTVARRAGDRRGEAAMLFNLGTAQWNMDRQEEAIDSFLAAADIFRELGADDGAAAALNNAGNSHLELGQFDEAAGYFDEALELAERSGLRDVEVIGQANIGFVLLELGRLGEAIEHCRRSIELCREAGLRHCEAHSVANLGAALLERGNPAEAIEQLTTALGMFRVLGEVTAGLEVLHRLANAYQMTARVEPALELAQEALESARRTGNRRAQAMSLSALGLTLHMAGQFPEAMRCFDETLNMLDDIRHLRTRLWILIGAAMAMLPVGRIEEALVTGRRALELAAPLPLYRARALLLLAHLLIARGGEQDMADAYTVAVQAREIYQQAGNPTGSAWSLHAMAKVWKYRGDGETADSLNREALRIIDGNGMAWAERIRAAVTA
ncbi:AfsR/SARP family transcriptional regulator [Kutzneria kofuensis]|uniref:DNA-binding SARP family transcriptional activator n=1 Tax=Kutzneria kofuensis TaxID=103725 RepID=A0A7W9NHG7_9PSEU|nr:BTAD domain-containing putative transcriptional regulator [Kutzneria kofuensis]MBB5892118.1 DNA-binding SARP family transcriptional activator [Kutzneria kofuensis]